ncbi:TasA family protein [Neobacillus drentensis]|uniref:TasA family protein n=1 Tax=Neobacillus drentensis TaxID=220684 RepID=UPI002FFF135D
MGIKKKLGLGVASAALGLSLIGGGTYAYFNTTATQTSSFASGTLNMAVNPTVAVPLTNLKPGDTMPKEFTLTNTGTLDIKKVFLHTDYSISDLAGNSVAPATQDRLADAIVVDFLVNVGDPKEGETKNYEVVASKSLRQLKAMTPDNLAKEFDGRLEQINNSTSHPNYKVVWDLVDGIKAGTSENSTDKFKVQFRFVDSGQPDQNDLQGKKLNLTWQFEGIQTDGEVRTN